MSRRVLLVTASAVVIAATMSFTARPALPGDAGSEPKRMTVLAFYDEESPGNLPRFRRVAGRVSVLIPEWFSFDPTRQTVAGRNTTPTAVAVARYHRVKIWPAVNAQVKAAKLFSDPARFRRALRSILAVARRWDGITLDLEGVRPAERDAFSRFVVTLARRLHAGHKGLAVYATRRNQERSTPRNAAFDYRALAASADYLLASSYSESWIIPGPVVSDGGYLSLLLYCGKISKRRIAPTLGALYQDWPARISEPKVGYTDEMGRLRPRRGVHTDRGETTFRYRLSHTVWYESPESLQSRINTARSLGFQALSLFLLGHEPASFWDAV
jgi:spore germination protein YaaH